jgi:Skp family chaperone for outer membrane proteins
MKTKVLFLLLLTSFFSLSTLAQRGVRIGYVDTEYILQNVPEYQDASDQLDSKVQKWKNEIEKRLSEIDQMKKQLINESVLLTKELVEERQEEISIEENEILDYQQKRFGPNGDLMIQKKQLIQPIQDQIFTAVQEIASNKKFDFVFDKSADVVMLYSADRFDISEQVLRSITRTSKRTQTQNRQERKVAEDEELVPEINKTQEARAKVLADKKASREKAIEDKRAKQLSDREAKKKVLEDKKKKILEDRAKAREEKLNARNKDSEVKTETKPEESNKESSEEKTSTKAEENKTKEISSAAAASVKKEEIPLSPSEAKKKALEDKKKKILADRKAKLEARKKTTSKKSAVNTTTDSTKTETKKLSPKEARKKELEDKKKKILADRKAKIEARQRVKDSIKNKENN